MAALDNASLVPFAGGWEAHRHRHCIWVVRPEGYPHYRVFDELAESLEAAFTELGGSAPIVGDPSEWNGRSPIVVGPQLLPRLGITSLPEGSILYNLEQVDLQVEWFNHAYISLLSRFPVLDYSVRNRDALEQIGIAHARLLEIGYSSKLTRIATDREKDVDLLFYGSTSHRRNAVIDDAKRRGLRVVSLFGVYGAERDEAIARAKIVLNMNQRRANIFETIRVSYLLANQVCVVTEGDAEDPDVQPFLGGLEIAPYEALVDRCVELASDDPRREELARSGFDRIRARPQSHLLAEVMLQRPLSGRGRSEPGAIRVSDQKFGAEQVPVDGGHFARCSFNGTIIAYRGGAVPVFEDCQFERVQFSLKGAAGNAAAFLRMLIDRNLIPGFR